METLRRLQERIIGGFGWLVVSIRELRLEDVRERMLAAWAARGRVDRSQALLILTIVVLVGGIVVFSVRSAATQSQERDFEFPVICANCGREDSMSREGMLDSIAYAQNKGFAAAGKDTAAPLGLCGKCEKLAIFRSMECPKCGKRIAPPFATVNGSPAAPKCRGCGWSATSARR